MRLSFLKNQQISKQVASSRFFYGVLALFLLQAAWIALSGRYPMAFDEDFHLGIIRLYAHHINPLWNGPAIGGDAFGAVTRDPSYLYHYLLSFIYRLLSLTTDNQIFQVISLRLINIALFAGGLVVYRRLLLKTKASAGLINSSLLVLVLLPVTPLLAAQINYDNLFFPLTGLALLLTLRVTENTKKRQVDIKDLVWLIIICLLTSLVKYAFLPIFASIFVFLIVSASRFYGSPGQLVKILIKSARRLSKTTVLCLGVGLVLAFGLFIERYGVNIKRYHRPVADCAQVLSYEHCQYYGPWIRDFNFSHSKGDFHPNPFKFTQHWFYGMWLRSFFAVGGANTDFQSRGPLVIPGVAAIVWASVGGLALLARIKFLWSTSLAAKLFLVVSSCYLVALWLEEFGLFAHTGQPVAINGRYLLPVLPLLICLMAISLAQILASRHILKLILGGLIVISLAWGGGALTFILRSNDNWYWPNRTVTNINHAVQYTIGPITPGYSNPVSFLH